VLGWLTKLFTPAAGKAPRAATLSGLIGNGPGSYPTLDNAQAARHYRGWAYACARLIAQRVAHQPIRVGKVTGNRAPKGSKSAGDCPPWMRPGSASEVADHPVLTTFADPNDWLTSWQLVYLLVASLQTTGVGFLWWDEEPGSEETRCWFIPSAWVRPDPDAPVMTRWIVRPPHSVETFVLDQDELIRVALPDPADPLGVLSPLMAAGAAVLADEAIMVAQLSAFRRGLMPGVAIKIGKLPELAGIGGESPALSKEQRQSLTDALRRLYGGAEMNGEPLILDGIVEDVKAITTSPKEMDFQTSGEVTKARITQAYGVNPISMGEVEGANRASSAVADEHLVVNVLAPVCTLLGQVFTRFFRRVFDDPKLVVWLDVPKASDPDGDRADLDQLIRAGGVTIDEVRARHGLPPLASGGDVLVKPRTDPASSQPSPGKGAGSWWDLLGPDEQHAVYARSMLSRNGN
jgi:HK97 family phage portal protein